MHSGAYLWCYKRNGPNELYNITFIAVGIEAVLCMKKIHRKVPVYYRPYTVVIIASTQMNPVCPAVTYVVPRR